MRLRTIRNIVFFAAAMFAFAANAASTPEEAGADIAARNDAIVGELRRLQNSGELSEDVARDLIRDHLSPIIDFRRLAGQAAGKYWRRAEKDEKKRIVAAFRHLLENVYAKVLSRYSDQKVVLADSKLRGDGTILVGVEVQDGAVAALLEYVLRDNNGELKITDVLVEKISLLDTYRRQFAQIAKKEGTAGLANRLEELAAR